MLVSGLKRLLAGLALIGLVAAGTTAIAEQKVGSTVESRVLLGFKVNDDAAAAFLPDGWSSFTVPKGPAGGANLIVALIDRHLILDADGKPETTSSGPTVALLAYGAKGQDGVRGFVIRVYEGPPLVDPYGTSVAASIARRAAYSDTTTGERSQSEQWQIRPEAGGKIDVQLDYTVGGFLWSTGNESKPFSPVTPDFHRIYRYDQLAGLAMNTAMGRPLDGTVSFTSDDPAVASLFDGSEALTAIISVPVYLREVSLP